VTPEILNCRSKRVKMLESKIIMKNTGSSLNNKLLKRTKTKEIFYKIQCHHYVTKALYTNFRKFSNKWLKDNSVSNECIDEWLLGGHIGNSIKTTCVKENSIKKPPYHVYFRYKTVYD